MSAAIPKPQLRGFLNAKVKKAITGATIFAISCGLVWKFTVQEPKKKAYAEFKRTYNDEERFRIMCKAGLLQSCDPASIK